MYRVQPCIVLAWGLCRVLPTDICRVPSISCSGPLPTFKHPSLGTNVTSASQWLECILIRHSGLDIWAPVPVVKVPDTSRSNIRHIGDFGVLPRSQLGSWR